MANKGRGEYTMGDQGCGKIGANWCAAKVHLGGGYVYKFKAFISTFCLTSRFEVLFVQKLRYLAVTFDGQNFWGM